MRACCVAGTVTESTIDASDAEDGFPHVSLTEMLHDMHIDDSAVGGSAAVMME